MSGYIRAMNHGHPAQINIAHSLYPLDDPRHEMVRHSKSGNETTVCLMFIRMRVSRGQWPVAGNRVRRDSI